MDRVMVREVHPLFNVRQDVEQVMRRHRLRVRVVQRQHTHSRVPAWGCPGLPPLSEADLSTTVYKHQKGAH